MLLIIIFGILSFPLLSAGLRSRVYETVRCPSVCASVRLSVPFAHCSSVRRVCCCGPGGQEISIDCCRVRFRGLPIAVTWGTTLSSLHVAICRDIIMFKHTCHEYSARPLWLSWSCGSYAKWTSSGRYVIWTDRSKSITKATAEVD